MNTITNRIVEQGLANRVLKVSQLKRLVKGSAQSRYNLVNRAIKTKELSRFQRGLYTLNDRFRDYPCHPFILAQALESGSYISFETALAYHGWIPEAVYTTASVVSHRKSRKFKHKKMGIFNFQPLAVKREHFLELVNRHQTNEQTMLIAKPCRALMDLICLRKLSWKGMNWLLEGMRIDPELLASITGTDIKILKLIYKQKRVKSYLSYLNRELGLD
jgi:predicted transcriptional regulator of viral defense system